MYDKNPPKRFPESQTKILRTKVTEVENCNFPGSTQKHSGITRMKTESSLFSKRDKENNRSVSNQKYDTNRLSKNCELIEPCDQVGTKQHTDHHETKHQHCQNGLKTPNVKVADKHCFYESRNSVVSRHSAMNGRPFEDKQGRNPCSSSVYQPTVGPKRDSGSFVCASEKPETQVLMQGKYTVGKHCANHPGKVAEFFIPYSHFLKNTPFVCKSFCSRCSINLVRENIHIEEIVEADGVSGVESIECREGLAPKSGIDKAVPIDVVESVDRATRTCSQLLKQVLSFKSKVNENYLSTFKQIEVVFKDISVFLSEKFGDLKSKIDSNVHLNESRFNDYVTRIREHGNKLGAFKKSLEADGVVQLGGEGVVRDRLKHMVQTVESDRVLIESTKVYLPEFFADKCIVNQLKSRMSQDLKLVFTPLLFKETPREQHGHRSFHERQADSGQTSEVKRNLLGSKLKKREDSGDKREDLHYESVRKNLSSSFDRKKDDLSDKDSRSKNEELASEKGPRRLVDNCFKETDSGSDFQQGLKERIEGCFPSNQMPNNFKKQPTLDEIHNGIHSEYKDRRKAVMEQIGRPLKNCQLSSAEQNMLAEGMSFQRRGTLTEKRTNKIS